MNANDETKAAAMVRELRLASDYPHSVTIFDRAADMIEFQAAEIERLTEELDRHEALAAKLNVADLVRENLRISNQLWHIEVDLAASQRRERAAVEDMKIGWTCRACAKRVVGKEWCMCPHKDFVIGPERVVMCANFEWRGPQEAEKEAER